MSVLACTVVRLLRYNPRTGLLVWRVNRGGSARAGTVAGTLSKGAIVVRLLGRSYQAHRLIWLYCYGVLPDDLDVDHRDGNPENNRLRNLRIGTRSHNLENQRHARSNNTAGFLGVSFRPCRSKPYRARIQVRGEQICLGEFYTPGEAHKIYIKAKRELHAFCTI